MADDGMPVYLPALEGKRWVRRWRLAVPGGFEQRVTVGTVPDGRWWVCARWDRLGGWLYDTEPAADAHAVRLREAWAAHHPGEWVVERNVVPAT